MMNSHIKLNLLKIVWLLFDGIIFFIEKWLGVKEGYQDGWLVSVLFLLPCVMAIFYFLIFPRLLEVLVKAGAVLISLPLFCFIFRAMGDAICYSINERVLDSILGTFFSLIFFLIYFIIPFVISKSGMWGCSLLNKNSSHSLADDTSKPK